MLTKLKSCVCVLSCHRICCCCLLLVLVLFVIVGYVVGVVVGIVVCYRRVLVLFVFGQRREKRKMQANKQNANANDPYPIERV
jgi:Flp pilus assembly protein TadB